MGMHLVWWGTLVELGRLPRYPDYEDSVHILDGESLLERWVEKMDSDGKVDGRHIRISFLSHRWDSLSDPDEERNKARALGLYGRSGSSANYSDALDFDHYYWIDQSCVHQDDDRLKQMAMLKLGVWMTTCTDFILFRSSKNDYEPRAWTRLERLIAYAYIQAELFVYLDESYISEEPIDVNYVVRKNKSFVKGEADGELAIALREPPLDSPYVSDEKDLSYIGLLAFTVKSACALERHARLKDHAKQILFGETLIRLSTAHYGMLRPAFSAKTGEAGSMQHCCICRPADPLKQQAVSDMENTKMDAASIGLGVKGLSSM